MVVGYESHRWVAIILVVVVVGCCSWLTVSLCVDARLALCRSPFDDDEQTKTIPIRVQAII